MTDLSTDRPAYAEAGAFDSGHAVIGIDLGGTKVDIAVAQLDGTVVGSTRISTDASSGARAVIRRALDAAAQLAAGRSITAVAIGAPGIVEDSVISLAPNIPGLDGMDILTPVGEHFPGASVTVVNDLNAAAFAELHGGALDGVGTGLIVGLGTGIAAGVIVGGVLQSGAGGAAGEIGQALVPSTVPPVILERFAGGAAFDSLARGMGLTGANDLLDRAQHDTTLAELVEPRLSALVSVIEVSCLLLNPARIAFFGGLAGSALLREFVSSNLAERLPQETGLFWAGRGDNPALRGAIGYALDSLGRR